MPRPWWALGLGLVGVFMATAGRSADAPALGSAAGAGPVESREAPEPGPQEARPGLLGHYYSPHVRPDWPDFQALAADVHGVPFPAAGKEPDATRIDARIAFGKDVGFLGVYGRQDVVWWPEDLRIGFVIWTGYLRLPRAGTYYLSAAADGATAIYLNRARVALKSEQSGGWIASDAFSYPETGTTTGPVSPERGQYLVPVTVDAPRDLPLAVHYRPHHHGRSGVDLYWVTPDSPRDAGGWPVASIVPPEALFVDPPGPIETGTTRSESSMIEAEFLYFPAAYSDDYFTLTVRLADEEGRPVAGRRVHVSGLVSYGQANEIVQPERPTDENGLTSARVRSGPGYKVAHESSFFATDVTDFVGVGQVAQVRFITSSPTFLPLTYAPYYDNRKFLVEPTPLRLGSPARVTVPLENRDRRPADLTVTFLTQAHNIGGARDAWGEIGKVENVRLEPGEVREVSVTWTPELDAYVCIKVEVFGRYLTTERAEKPNGASSSSLMAGVRPPPGVFASLRETELTPRQQPVPAPRPTPTPRGEGDDVFESVQRNVGTVGPPQPSKGPLGGTQDYWHGVRERANWLNSRLGFPSQFDDRRGDELTRTIDAGREYWGAGASGAKTVGFGLERYRYWVKVPTLEHTATGKPRYRGPATGRFARAPGPPPRFTVARAAGVAWGWAGGIGALGIWLADTHLHDPPDPNFMQIHTPPESELVRVTDATEVPDAVGHAWDAWLNGELQILLLMDAALVAMERYEGAVLAGNADAAERQFNAYVEYLGRSADAFATVAPVIEELVAAMRAANFEDIVLTPEDVRGYQDHLSTNGVDEEGREGLALLGLPEGELERVVLPTLLAADPETIAGSMYEGLLERAAYLRRAPSQLRLTREELELARSAATALSGDSRFAVANPTDRDATIDLRIRRASIPPQWKLSVVDAPDGDPEGGSDNSAAPLVREVTPGEHYRLRLPPGGETRVASVLVPVGPVGPNTTARWAVEGYIGTELIGGMMHEMHVPALLADLELPPVSGEGSRGVGWPGPAAVLGFLAILAVFVARRRRHAS